MAEAVVSDLATKIIEDLGSRFIKEIGLILGVEDELEKLKESLSRIKAILLDAEKKGAMNHGVKDWLGKLKDIAYDAEDLIDEFATEALRQKVDQDVLDESATKALRQGVELPNKTAHQVPSCFTSLVRRCFSGSDQLVFRSELAHRIKDIIERLDRIEKEYVYSTFGSTPDQSVDINDEYRRHTNKEFSKELNENVCQSLFNEWAFGRQRIEANHPDQELVEIGKEIVKKCGGVPLAAKALGGVLSHTRYEKDWLDVLKTEIWNLEDENEILPALRISYNQLPSHLKQCFAYCSLFPQDHIIEVDDLIHQWMAHGFIQPPPPPSRRGESPLMIEDIGHRYFRELLWRSFFQEVEEDNLGNIVTCKIHELVHNLARWVAGKEWWEVAGSSSSSSSSSSIPEGVRHVVVVFHGNKEGDPTPLIQPTDDDKAQKLRTLYLQCDSGLQLSDGFVSGFRGLRVLNLSDLGMEDVPSSIGDLQHLRYLDLSRNKFKALPNSICRLYNLQTLSLKDCMEFNEWPRDITKLVSLRHLELSYETIYSGPLKYMPCGLGKLTSLHTLGLFIVSDPKDPTILEKDLMGGGAGLGELHGLNQLRGGLQICGLENVGDAEEANLKEKSELQSLRLSWDSCNRSVEDEQLVLGNLQPHPNLKALVIEHYSGAKMPCWIIRSSSLFPHLVELRLRYCGNLKCLPLIGEFPYLKHLELFQLKALKSLCNKVMGGGGVKPLVLFPLLEGLQISRVANLERWTISVVEGEREGDQGEGEEEDNHLHLLSSMFPRLTFLDLIECPKLTTLPNLSVGGRQHLISLRHLNIQGLRRLVSLPDYPAPATLEELYIERCPNLVRLPDCFFDNLKFLSRFEISECSELTTLPEGIQHLSALKLLRIHSCPGLITLPQGLGNLSSLQQLTIWKCSNLSSLPEGIPHLTALKLVKIERCPGLIALPQGLGNLSSLEQLTIRKCSNLSSLPEGIQLLNSLKMLEITGCPRLITLPQGLANLSSLQQLTIWKCPNLSSLPEHLNSLKYLSISKCPRLRSLPDGLENLASHCVLEISDCPNLSLPRNSTEVSLIKDDD